MFRKLLSLNVVGIALTALAYLTDQEGGGGEGYLGTAAARAGETPEATRATPLDSNFRPFCQWINRHIKAGAFTVNHEGRILKVAELLGDGRVQLLDGGQSIYVPFEGTMIDQLLAQV